MYGKCLQAESDIILVEWYYDKYIAILIQNHYTGRHCTFTTMIVTYYIIYYVIIVCITDCSMSCFS